MQKTNKYSLNNPKLAFDHELDLWSIVDDDGYVIDWYVTKDEAVTAMFEIVADMAA